MIAKMLLAEGAIQQAARMLAEALVDNDTQLSILLRRHGKADRDILAHLQLLYGIKLDTAAHEQEFVCALLYEFDRVEGQ